MKIRGVITAAGDSSRLGQPKALLEISGETFIERLSRILDGGGVDEVVLVIGGRHAPELIKECERLDIDPVHNPDPERGPISSILCGMKKPGNWDLLLVQPVDVIGVSESDVRQLIESQRRYPDHEAWILSHGMRRGHPVMIIKEAASTLETAGGPEHLRALLGQPEMRLHHEVTDNPLILEDVDDLQDWERIQSLM
ncbi:MAG: hypothetical protein CBC13_05955 [Planctomycetia bacterium TMED53]|nr:MAG: hypothetical protein CBC13_05955 [Planctomycetia bacterium TMED53]